MSKLSWWINSIEQPEFGFYRYPENPYRKANELWKKRFEAFRLLGIPAIEGRMTFEVAADDGAICRHDDVLQRIKERPALREPVTER